MIGGTAVERQTDAAKNTNGLQPFLSPLAVWVLSVGSAIS